MNYRQGVVTGVAAAAAAAAVAGGAWWLATSKTAPPEAAKTPLPASVAKIAKEDAFNTVTLTPEGEDRLKVQVAKVENKPVRRQRLYGGEVVVPPGSGAIVSAPVAGTLKASPKGLPKAGASVQKGQTVMLLLPVLTAEGSANLKLSMDDLEGQAKSAAEALKGAKDAYDRAVRIKKNAGGAQKDVDATKSAYDAANEALTGLKNRRDKLTKILGDLEKGTAEPIPIDCPAEGIVRNVSALPGQSVHAGAVLFEVFDPRTAWIRVPVYVGDEPDVDQKAEARVGPLTHRPDKRDDGVPLLKKPDESFVAAKPADAPPAANVLAGTADLFYEMANPKGEYRPGQRVAVVVAPARRGVEPDGAERGGAVRHLRQRLGVRADGGPDVRAAADRGAGRGRAGRRAGLRAGRRDDCGRGRGGGTVRGRGRVREVSLKFES